MLDAKLPFASQPIGVLSSLTRVINVSKLAVRAGPRRRVSIQVSQARGISCLRLNSHQMLRGVIHGFQDARLGQLSATHDAMARSRVTEPFEKRKDCL